MMTDNKDQTDFLLMKDRGQDKREIIMQLSQIDLSRQTNIKKDQEEKWKKLEGNVNY